jgi:hypothetical protein
MPPVPQLQPDENVIAIVRNHYEKESQNFPFVRGLLLPQDGQLIAWACMLKRKENFVFGTRWSMLWTP